MKDKVINLKELNNTSLMNQDIDGRILVVDDNLPMRKALAETLKFLNYQTLEAENGLDALKIIELIISENQDPGTACLALVICDLSMPLMNGRELFDELKKRRINIPFVMLSGYMASNELDDLKNKGLAGWLQKPADIGQISRLLEKILR
jgi:CheY-like chemotaxis protein